MKQEKNKCLVLVALFLLLIFSLWRTTLGMHSDEVHSIAVGDMIEEGNIFFKECWFYLQLSAVFTAPIIHLFKLLTGGTEGILLCFRILSVLIQLLISVFFFSTFSKEYNKKYVLCASVAFFVFIPDFQSFNYKQEFIWFSLLEIIFIYRYYKSKKKEYLVLLSLAIAASVLAYPTAVLQFVFFIILLLYLEVKEGEDKKQTCRSFLYLIVPCFICAVCFMAWVLKDISFAEFIKYFMNVFMDENLDSSFISKLKHPLIKYILLGLMTLLPMYFATKIERLRVFINKYKIPVMTVLLWGAFLLQVYIERRGVTWHCITYPYALTVFLLPIIFNRKDKEKNICIFYFFELSAILSILIMSLASNQGNITSMYGMVISMMGVLLLVGEDDQANKKEFVDESKISCISIVIMALLMFVFPIYEQEVVMATNNSARTIFTERVSVEYGPAKGIKLGKESFEKYDELCSIIIKNVGKEDSLFIVDDHENASYGYLISEGNHATFSPQGGWGVAMSDRAVRYFEENPMKTPTVVIINLEYIDLPIAEYLEATPVGRFLELNDYKISSEYENYVVMKK